MSPSAAVASKNEPQNFRVLAFRSKLYFLSERERERESVYMCVCCVRERETERERGEGTFYFIPCLLLPVLFDRKKDI